MWLVQWLVKPTNRLFSGQPNFSSHVIMNTNSKPCWPSLRMRWRKWSLSTSKVMIKDLLNLLKPSIEPLGRGKALFYHLLTAEHTCTRALYMQIQIYTHSASFSHTMTLFRFLPKFILSSRRVQFSCKLCFCNLKGLSPPFCVLMLPLQLQTLSLNIMQEVKIKTLLPWWAPQCCPKKVCVFLCLTETKAACVTHTAVMLQRQKGGKYGEVMEG